MADPLALDAFWERLRFAARPEFVLVQNAKQSASGSGQILRAAFARPAWSVSVALAGGRHDRNLEAEAMLKRLDGVDGTFLAYDIRRPYPLADPQGAKLGDTVAAVLTKGSNNRSLSLEDLPPRQKITRGDKISIAYGTSSLFLCEAMDTVTADVSGETVEFEIWPPLPAAIEIGDAVTLAKPAGKFKIVAGSYRPGSGSGNSATGPGFSMVSVP